MNATHKLLGRLLFRPKGVTVHQFSSRSREGLNRDAGWHLYKDEQGDAVIFDAAGPGCVRSMWNTAVQPDASFKFYFDGETAPRYIIPIRDFYQGKHPLFPKPLVSYERRGYYGDNPYAGNSFVPMPFAKSLKISVSGNPAFYHVLFEKYPYGTRVRTFTGREERNALLDAFRRPSANPWQDMDLEGRRRLVKAIKPQGTASLFDLRGAGCVRRLSITCNDDPELLRKVFLQIRWDDSRLFSVVAPLGAFFAVPVKADNVCSLPMRVRRLPGGQVRLTCFFPMPFRSRASVSLRSRCDRPVGPISATVAFEEGRTAGRDPAYFTTLYREGCTDYGRDWLLFESPGRGWYLGSVQSMVHEHYCEGDEHFYIDGTGSPQINGTGSEDYYLACFWPQPAFNTPFNGCTHDVRKAGHDYNNPSAYYRFHLETPIPFYSAIDARIQHGGESDIRSDYTSCAFCYLHPRPTLAQTDLIDVGNRESEKAHSYRATQSRHTGTVEARYEGQYLHHPVRDAGRTHHGGQIAFRVTVDPRNRGLRLRRRLDQKSPRQTAHVFIDGEFAGTWYHADTNAALRWFDSDFDVHPRLTRGKGTVNVRLEVDASHGPFTDFRYHAFCFK
ncbi:DUF2961 domain-containing protein [Verrucomicrobiota bacterium]